MKLKARSQGKEKDSSKNYQINLNGKASDNIKLKSIYGRKTKSDYDGSATNEGVLLDNKMYAIQSGLEHKTKNSESDLKVHYHKYDRDYANNGFLDDIIVSLWF